MSKLLRAMFWGTLIPVLAFGEDMELPDSSKTLLEKFDAFKIDEKAKYDGKIAKASSSAKDLLANHRERETKAGNLDAVLALKGLDLLAADLDLKTLHPELPNDSKAVVGKFLAYAKTQKKLLTQTILGKQNAVVRVLETHVAEQTAAEELENAVAIREQVTKLKELAEQLSKETSPSIPEPSKQPSLPFVSSGAKGRIDSLIANAGAVEVADTELLPLKLDHPDKHWSSVPARLESASAGVYWSTKRYHGIAEYKVIAPGYLIIACNFSSEGSSGEWQETLWLEADFKKEGWRTLTESQLGGKLIRSQGDKEMVLLFKDMKVGETGKLRCSKYNPPYFITFPK